MTLAENSARLRVAADALDLAALAVAIEARTTLLAGEAQTDEDRREASAAGDDARFALEALKKCFALESARLGQIRTGFAAAGIPLQVDCRA